MATVLVKNLPQVSEVDNDDLLIVNVGGGSEYTTSNITVGALQNNFRLGDQNFEGDVFVNGDVRLTKTDGRFAGTLEGNCLGSSLTVVSISEHTTDELPQGSNNYYMTPDERQGIADNTQGIADLVLDLGKLENDTTAAIKEVGERLGPDFNENYTVTQAVDDLGGQISALDTSLGSIGGQVNNLDSAVLRIGNQVGSFDEQVKGTCDARLDTLENDTTAADAAKVAADAAAAAADASSDAADATSAAGDASTLANDAAAAAATAASAAAAAQSTADGNKAGAAAGATAVQRVGSGISVTNLPVDGTATVDTLAAAINTLSAEVAAILNT